MISTIWLSPHADTRERLLAPGAPMYDKVLRVFGWVVPTPSGSPRPSGWIDSEADTLGLRRLPVDADTCLVLARDGAVVPEGVDRLARVTGLSADVIERALLRLRARVPVDDVVARTIAAVGTLVLLDSSGSEVSP